MPTGGTGQIAFRVPAGSGITTRDVNVRVTAHKTTCTNYDSTHTFNSGSTGADVANHFATSMAAAGFSCTVIGKSIFISGIDKFDASASSKMIKPTFGRTGSVKVKRISKPPSPRTKRFEVVSSGAGQGGQVRMVGAGLAFGETATESVVRLSVGKGKFFASDTPQEALARIADDLRHDGWSVMPMSEGGFAPYFTSDGVDSSTVQMTPLYASEEDGYGDDHWICYIGDDV